MKNMRTLFQGKLFCYSFAVFTVGLALTIKLLLPAYLGKGVPFLLFFLSVITSSLYCGMSAGLLATVLSAFVGAYFFIPPFHSVNIGVSGSIQTVVFLVEGLFISMLSTKIKRAEEVAKKSSDWFSTTLKSIGDAVITTD